MFTEHSDNVEFVRTLSPGLLSIVDKDGKTTSFSVERDQALKVPDNDNLGRVYQIKNVGDTDIKFLSAERVA